MTFEQLWPLLSHLVEPPPYPALGVGAAAAAAVLLLGLVLHRRRSGDADPGPWDDGSPAAAVRGLKRAGAAMVFVFFAGFGAWATLAPLASATIAPGVVSPEGQRRMIQHLEGGIVAEILVRDGSEVAAGEVLVRLDEIQTRARRDRLWVQLRAAAARAARLVAERDNAGVAFPAWLEEATAADPEVARVLAGERRVFGARRSALASRAAILRQRIAQLREEVAGLEAEIATQDEQRRLIGEEIADVGGLLQKGLERKSRLLGLQRRGAEIEGSRAQNTARIARAGQAIGEARLQIQDLATGRLNEVVQELREIETTISDLREQIGAAEDVLRRTEVIAPVTGTVVDLRVVTPGAVIGPGEPILDLVPSGDRLVVEAYVEPTDVDAVHAGLPAQVRLTAFNQRRTPTFMGTVERVSADRLEDERTGRPYYLARVALDDGQPELEGLVLQPGMPAEVMIVTGERTALDYLVRPITASLNRALREE